MPDAISPDSERDLRSLIHGVETRLSSRIDSVDTSVFELQKNYCRLQLCQGITDGQIDELARRLGEQMIRHRTANTDAKIKKAKRIAGTIAAVVVGIASLISLSWGAIGAAVSATASNRVVAQPQTHGGP